MDNKWYTQLDPVAGDRVVEDGGRCLFGGDVMIYRCHHCKSRH